MDVEKVEILHVLVGRNKEIETIAKKYTNNNKTLIENLKGFSSKCHSSNVWMNLVVPSFGPFDDWYFFQGQRIQRKRYVIHRRQNILRTKKQTKKSIKCNLELYYTENMRARGKFHSINACDPLASFLLLSASKTCMNREMTRKINQLLEFDYIVSKCWKKIWPNNLMCKRKFGERIEIDS